jgi:hypothetical protein
LVKSKQKVEDLLDVSQRTENEIAELREELVTMTRRIHEIDYVLENNQMKEFVDENINHLKFEKVYAEVPQTSEIQFNEYDGKLEVVDEKGELIFEELTNFNNVSTDSYGKNFNTFN